MTTSWNDNIFDGIKAVNRNLFKGGLPERAANLLYDMECCLCSGDGLTEGTAFRACDDKVVDRVLGLLGVRDAVRRTSDGDGLIRVDLAENSFGIGSLYFCR